MTEVLTDHVVRHDDAVASSLVSGDGHLEVTIEPWMKFVPEKYQDQAPRLIHLPEGGEGWIVEGMPMFHNGMNLAAGRHSVKLRGRPIGSPTAAPLREPARQSKDQRAGC